MPSKRPFDEKPFFVMMSSARVRLLVKCKSKVSMISCPLWNYDVDVFSFKAFKVLLFWRLRHGRVAF